MKIRQDEKGLYIKGPFDLYRPGGVPGYDHVYDMSDGGLTVNDNPKTSYVTGTPLIKIKLADNRLLYWATEYTHNLYAKH